ncbi:hypothetical protein A4X09_0g4382, partial [Tilletia walkeri]
MASADEIVARAKADGPQGLADLKIKEIFEKGLGDKKNAATRENTCKILTALCEESASHQVEPFLFDGLYETFVETMGDKEKEVRVAAKAALIAYSQVMSSWAVPQVLKILLHQMQTAGKWQVKTGAIAVLEKLVVSSPDRIAASMPDI